MDNKINLALVGFGRFGKKYYKNLNQNKHIKFVKKYKKKNTIQKKFHRFLKEEIEKNNFKGGIVATPTKTHYQISKEFIKNKIPIILEKPAGFKVIEVNKMIYLSKNLPSIDELKSFNPEQVSKIISSDNEVIHKLQAVKKREVVKIGNVPQYLINALLLMEDREFGQGSLMMGNSDGCL